MLYGLELRSCLQCWMLVPLQVSLLRHKKYLPLFMYVVSIIFFIAKQSKLRKIGRMRNIETHMKDFCLIWHRNCKREHFSLIISHFYFVSPLLQLLFRETHKTCAICDDSFDKSQKVGSSTKHRMDRNGDDDAVLASSSAIVKEIPENKRVQTVDDCFCIV